MWSLWYRLRAFLWGRLFIRYPAKPGWQKLVRDVVAAELWRGDDGIVGAPLEWSMLARDPEGRVVPVEDRCAWTGQQISGATPLLPDGKPDLSHYGVRCARCGVRIHVLAAGMRSSVDVPSCPPCRRAVRAAMESV